MTTTHLARRLLGTVATGVVGVGVVEAATRIAGPELARRAAVAGAAWGLRGIRSVETGAESVRLVTADILAEAKDRLGEQATPPGPDLGHDHEH
ncbi:MAG: DUF1490 family protein [Nocardioides sp.]|uniref:DUF1490 family protein n=1 Tax=Nocardioides sp. TaxID=35761 RepID=UPI0039E250AD